MSTAPGPLPTPDASPTPGEDELLIRPAVEADLPAVVAMLADDTLGASREDPSDLAPYRRAFLALAADPNQHLVVAERAGRVVGTLQLTVIPGLSLKGTTRGLIEGVRVHADERGNGLGSRFIAWAVEKSRAEGCAVVQLTSDKSRVDAHRFYERLGFTGSHLGFKLKL
ncbi:GNAT family N-acetyltransferase [Streptomyces sp. BI20]|uniref:GNAT family N-acetyltransferase n=1 Tax=Streptomyces sp. BI20 TaxID=3403460 RepID=UPI003C78D937